MLSALHQEDQEDQDLQARPSQSLPGPSSSVEDSFLSFVGVEALNEGYAIVERQALEILGGAGREYLTMLATTIHEIQEGEGAQHLPGIDVVELAMRKIQRGPRNTIVDLEEYYTQIICKERKDNLAYKKQVFIKSGYIEEVEAVEEEVSCPSPPRKPSSKRRRSTRAT